ncbi:transposase [Streptomyces pharetrae]|uniref:transposase n=1 Tax=Streptomyces pharetrae TaxID=291370 RepID=UPI00384B24D5
MHGVRGSPGSAGLGKATAGSRPRREWKLLAPLIPLAAVGRQRWRTGRSSTGWSTRSVPGSRGETCRKATIRERRSIPASAATRSGRVHPRSAADPRGRHRQDEPGDHALGRSRGGLTTKIHLAFDGKGHPLAILVTPGQHHDSICARPLLERIRGPRPGPGRLRCRPDQVIADKALGNGLGPIGDGLG